MQLTTVRPFSGWLIYFIVFYFLYQTNKDLLYIGLLMHQVFYTLLQLDIYLSYFVITCKQYQQGII